MENMIKRIIDADNEAQALEESTLKEKEELNKSIDEEISRIRAEYTAKAEETVKLNNASEEKKADMQWEEMKNKQKSVLIKLKSDFEQNCDKWADEIVSRTLAK